MNGHDFDRLTSQLVSGRLGRREILRRAAALGLGATALSTGLRLRPGHAFAAPTGPSPFDPPPGWPDDLPWPFGPLDGPCFPVPVPRETTRETGIAFYIASLDPDGTTGVIVGIDKKGKELSRFDFRSDGRALEWSITGAGAKLDGQLEDRSDSERLVANWRVAGIDVETSGRRDGTELLLPEKSTLKKSDQALLTQWNRIGKTVFDLGQSLDLTASGGATQASCGTCLLELGGLAIWGGGCAFAPSAAVACGGFLVAYGVWAGACESSCAD